MLRSFNTIKSGLSGIMEVNDTIANNMSNINTTGFKQSKILFKDVQEVEIMKMKHGPIDEKEGNVAGTLSLGPAVDKYIVDFSQGDLITTGNKLDLAINGEGFFHLEDSDGSQFYTRNGNFTLDNESYLTTLDGKYVLDQEGARVFLDVQNLQGDGITVTPDGQIAYGTEILGSVGVVEFENKDSLVPRDGTLFENIDETNRGDRPQNVNIVQGSIEASNANSVQTMIKSIEALRSYETMTNALKMTGDTLRQAVTQVGKFT